MSVIDDHDVWGKFAALRPDVDLEVLRALHGSATDVLGSVPAVSQDPTRLDPLEWSTFADLGWLGIPVPGDLGGADDLAAAGVIARCLGRAGRREPYVAAAVVTPLWLAAISQQDGAPALLKAVLNGTHTLVPAWQPRDGALAVAHDDLPTVSHTASSRRLSGVVCWVGAEGADGYLIVARDQTGTVLVHVPVDAVGATLQPVAMSDASLWGHLELREVEVPPERLFSLSPDDVEQLQHAVDAAVLTVSAELLGATEGMLDLTRTYLHERRQFGRLIGSNQVLQHKTVDMWLQQELLSSALAECYARVDLAPDALAPLASGAKSRACQVARAVGNAAVQLHGAIGFTSEYALSHLVNRSLVLSAWLGNREDHLVRWASLTRHEESA